MPHVLEFGSVDAKVNTKDKDFCGAKHVQFLCIRKEESAKILCVTILGLVGAVSVPNSSNLA